MLLRSQTDANWKAVCAHKALFMAASNGHAEIVSLLLDAGATVTQSAVTIAEKNNHQEVVAILKAQAPSVLA